MFKYLPHLFLKSITITNYQKIVFNLPNISFKIQVHLSYILSVQENKKAKKKLHKLTKKCILPLFHSI